MKTLYFDCFAGASGNMLLGALVGLGVASDELHSELAKMDVPAFEIVFETRDKSGIAALHADVRVPDEKNHRHLHHIEGIITNSALSDGVKSRALSIFRTLAAAEAKVHGIDISKVHFHEVGALDAIIDIVGCCICFEKLGIESFASSKLHVGSGFVEMAHGKFPVPPPAVAEILRDAPVYSTEITGELVTPTGAAIIATVCKSFGPIPEIRIEKVSYGAGTRDYMNFPNAIRLIVGRSSSGGHLSKLLLIETNVDDITGQTLGYLMEKAFEAGALDCWFTPIQMKKNRPATQISILCTVEARSAMIELLYLETSTLGARVIEVERDCLPRVTKKIGTRFGEITVKVAKYQDRVVSAKPEYGELRRAAAEFGLPLLKVESEVDAIIGKLISDDEI